MKIYQHILHLAVLLAVATDSFILSEIDGHLSRLTEAVATYENYNTLLANKLKQTDETIWEEKIIPMMVYENKVWESPMGTCLGITV